LLALSDKHRSILRTQNDGSLSSDTVIFGRLEPKYLCYFTKCLFGSKVPQDLSRCYWGAIANDPDHVPSIWLSYSMPL